MFETKSSVTVQTSFSHLTFSIKISGEIIQPSLHWLNCFLTQLQSALSMMFMIHTQLSICYP